MQKSWSILFGVVLLASLGLFVVAPFVGWWLPRSVCSYGPGIYLLFYLILGVTGFFFILTEAILVYNLYAFAGTNGRKAEYTHGNHRLEVFWTAVPAVLLLLLAFSQIPIWHKIKSTLPGSDVQVMEVSARQFEWRVRYPSVARMQESGLPDDFAKEAQQGRKHADDVYRVNEIHVWKGAKARVSLKTRDVLHSFFLPNIPTKQDAVPGKTITVWFDANEANTIPSGDRWVDGRNVQLIREKEKAAEEKEQQAREQQGQAPEKAAALEKEARALRDEVSQLRATEAKDYIWELACAELCGWGHYKMRGKLYVHESREDFLNWLQAAAAEQNRTTAEK